MIIIYKTSLILKFGAIIAKKDLNLSHTRWNLWKRIRSNLLNSLTKSVQFIIEIYDYLKLESLASHNLTLSIIPVKVLFHFIVIWLIIGVDFYFPTIDVHGSFKRSMMKIIIYSFPELSN